MEAFRVEREERQKLIMLLEKERKNVEAVIGELEATAEVEELKRISKNLDRFSKLEQCSLESVILKESQTVQIQKLIYDYRNGNGPTWSRAYTAWRAYGATRGKRGSRIVPRPISNGCQQFLTRLEREDPDISDELRWYFVTTYIRQ